MRKKTFLKISLIFLLIPEMILAQIIDCPYLSNESGKTLLNYPNNATGTENLSEALSALLKNLTYFIKECLVKPALIIVILISGIYIMTSLGNPGKIEKGKTVLLAAIIGLIIIFGAEAIAGLFGKYIK